jgi:hypothetical protein
MRIRRASVTCVASSGKHPLADPALLVTVDSHKGYKAVGNSCAQTCTQASCCKVPANAIPACHSKICSWTCKKGYEKRGGKCVLKPGTCKVAKDCPKPPKNVRCPLMRRRSRL